MKNIKLLINRLIDEGIVVVPDENDFSSMYLTPLGGKKLTESGLILPDDPKEKMKFLRSAINKGVLCPKDIHSKLLALPQVDRIPGLREDVAKVFADTIKKSGADFDILCSLPYAGTSIGVLTASKLGVPHTNMRKNEDHRHGPTSAQIKPGETALLLDDVLYQGNTIVNDAQKLRMFNVKISDAAVFLDRNSEGGGKKKCKRWGIDVHSVLDTEKLKHIIKKNPNIPDEVKTML